MTVTIEGYEVSKPIAEQIAACVLGYAEWPTPVNAAVARFVDKLTQEVRR